MTIMKKQLTICILGIILQSSSFATGKYDTNYKKPEENKKNDVNLMGTGLNNKESIKDDVPINMICKKYETDKKETKDKNKDNEQKYTCVQVKSFSQDDKKATEKHNEDKKVTQKKTNDKASEVTYPIVEQIVIFKYKDEQGNLRYNMQPPTDKKVKVVEVKNIYKIISSEGTLQYSFTKPKDYKEEEEK